MHKLGRKKINDLFWFTPGPGTLVKAALFKDGNWDEIYRNEVFLAHKSHESQLKQYGFVRAQGVRVHRTIKAALRSRKRFNLSITE